MIQCSLQILKHPLNVLLPFVFGNRQIDFTLHKNTSIKIKKIVELLKHKKK